MATKYAEGYLAIRYRHIEDGRIIGGPYAYIEYGMGKKFKWLAKVFAMLGMLAAIMGIGTLIQINGITDAAANVFGKSSLDFTLFGKDISIYSVITGLIIAVLTALILIGGVKRIGRVCEYLVPIMAITYITICLTVIFTHVTSIPSAFVEIVKMAFTGRAAVAGVIGITIRDAIKEGVSKGIFTNEAGLGSAPIAIIGPKGAVYLKEGCIVAMRHIHMSPKDAQAAGVKDGDIVSVKADNERGTIFNQVKIRVDDSFTLEMHIDTDEANAARIATGNTVTIIK